MLDTVFGLPAMTTDFTTASASSSRSVISGRGLITEDPFVLFNSVIR